jgi:cytochrome P450
MTSRVARQDTRIGEYSIPAGTRVFVALAAANRDPRRWDKPNEFIMGRPQIREHLAFSKGPHVCVGAPLARVEVRIILEQFLGQTAHIDFDEKIHGRCGDRRFDFEPSFIIRGLSSLHVTLAGR